MQDKIFQILVNRVGAEFQKAPSLYNIYPKHIPDGAIDNNYSQALIYNIIQAQINYTLTFYTIQLSVFHLNYGECRRIAVLIKQAFNSQDFTVEENDLISSTVTDIIELEYDTETGYYGIAVNTVWKTNKNI